jgi:hypothetical protein
MLELTKDLSIADRLKGMGYDADFEGNYPAGFHDLEQVKKPRPLTERGSSNLPS